MIVKGKHNGLQTFKGIKGIKGTSYATAKLVPVWGLPESYRKQFEKYKNGEGLQKEAMAEAAKKAQALLSKHSKEKQPAQTKLAKLKKKYSSVQSSNDLSTATKRNWLQDKFLYENY